MQSETTTNPISNNTKIWIGIAVGAAVGLGIALSRRGHGRRSRWDDVTRRIGESSSDFAEATRDIADRIKTIYDESRRVVEEAGAIWSHGRKLVGH
jgi:hypothetical protein